MSSDDATMAFRHVHSETMSAVLRLAPFMNVSDPTRPKVYLLERVCSPLVLVRKRETNEGHQFFAVRGKPRNRYYIESILGRGREWILLPNL